MMYSSRQAILDAIKGIEADIKANPDPRIAALNHMKQALDLTSGVTVKRPIESAEESTGTVYRYDPRANDRIADAAEDFLYNQGNRPHYTDEIFLALKEAGISFETDDSRAKAGMGTMFAKRKDRFEKTAARAGQTQWRLIEARYQKLIEERIA